MKKFMMTLIFILLTNVAFAEGAQIGENQGPPKKIDATGCSFALDKKASESATASKTEVKKSKTINVKGN